MLDLDPRIDLTAPIYEQAQTLRAQDKAENAALAMLEFIKPYLTADDDPGLWKLVLHTVLVDAQEAEAASRRREKQFVKIGSCSHWFRPHQARWTAAGGFAWPSGWHGVTGFTMFGLPELDWSVLFEGTNGEWKPVKKFKSKSHLEIRVSIPARTARHAQAAIHTLWSPPNHRVFYGFRKKDDDWKLAARSEFYAEEE